MISKTKLNIKSMSKLNRCQVWVWLAGLFILALPANAQEEGARTAVRSSGENRTPQSEKFSNVDRPIIPGDRLDIQIEKAPELSGQFRVDAKGIIYMNFLGNIMAQNLTLDELTQKIADGLRSRYLNNPQVRVTMGEYYKYSFAIQGAVKRPGIYELVEERPTFWALIVQAGGFDKECGTTAFVIRTNKTPISTEMKPKADADNKDNSKDSESDLNLNREVIRVKISGLLKGDLRQDILLEPGDVITIPPADVFFMAGEVNAPGRFTLAEGMTLRQAISLAQGTTITAAKGKGKIFRENSITGSLEELGVDIGAVMEGKKPDILLVANDIIMIPGSRFKSVGTALLKSFGYSVGSVPLRRF